MWFFATVSAASLALQAPSDITRLGDSISALIQSVRDETVARKVVTTGQQKWCDAEEQARQDTIMTTEEKLGQVKVDLAAASSQRDAAAEKVAKLKQALLEKEGDLSELEKKLDDEKASCKKQLEELTRAGQDVDASLLAQPGRAARPSTDQSLASLRALDAELLTPSFLQKEQSENPEEEVEKAREAIQKQCGHKENNIAKKMKTVKAAIVDLESEMETNHLQVAQQETLAAGLQRQQSSSSRTLDRETKLQGAVKESCTSYAQFAEGQDTLRAQQSEGLIGARDMLRVLTRADLIQLASFVQVSSTQQWGSAVDTELVDTSAELETSSLVSSDPLGEVKAKIQGMVEALKAAENAEKGPADFCSTELAKNREEKRTKKDDVDRLAAEARQADAQMQGHTQTQHDAQLGRSALLASKQQVELATSTEEKRISTEGADHKLCMEVLDKAVSVVNQEFGLSLIQGASTSKQVDASHLVAKMQEVRNAFAQQSGEAESFLTELNTRASNTIGDLQATLGSIEEELAAAKTGEATQGDAKAQAKESAATARAELAAIVSYIENLGKQCGPQFGNTKEELTRQKKEEIDSLKEALKVLEGEGVPVMSLVAQQPAQPQDAAQRAAAALGI